MRHSWKPFPFEDEAYDNPGSHLKERWPLLHKGEALDAMERLDVQRATVELAA